MEPVEASLTKGDPTEGELQRQVGTGEKGTAEKLEKVGPLSVCAEPAGLLFGYSLDLR